VKRIRLRVSLVTVAFVLLVAGGWWYFWPTNLGGSTKYVITHGTSMEPRFHSGDLAIVRPSSEYKVGQIVAYWSTLLHTVVLHRIHAIQGNTYLFKGDNNDFIDPIHPTRAELLGKLWLHVPRAGLWLEYLHVPAVAAAICALVGLSLLFGFGEQQRRRKRRRKGAQGSVFQRASLVNTTPDHGSGPRINYGAFLTASAVAVAVFAVLGLIAFTRPADKPGTATNPYTQQATFGYSATAPVGPVYPTGTVHTGEPIFLSQVRELGVHVKYQFVSTAPHSIVGTEKVVLVLTGQTGWSRTIVLTPTTHFTGDHTNTTVMLDMHHIEALLAKVGALTGLPTTGYTISIEPRVHVTGSVAARPLDLTFDPAMNFQLGASQLLSEGASDTGASTNSGSAAGVTAKRAGNVGTPTTLPATVSALGVYIRISLLRWLSIVGLMIAAAATVFLYLRKRSETFEESVKIQSQHGHLIVPIVAGEDLGWPPVDVPNIKALVRLAESGQRLILHNRSGDVDTYMVNDEGTVYRYQVRSSKVVWGEWTDAPVPVDHAADAAEAA